MDYRYLLKEENEAVRERYELSLERIRAMKDEEMREPYGSYFRRTGAFIEMIAGLTEQLLSGRQLSMEELKGRNERLYHDILPENYGESFANPSFAAEKLGK